MSVESISTGPLRQLDHVGLNIGRFDAGESDLQQLTNLITVEIFASRTTSCRSTAASRGNAVRARQRAVLATADGA
jgi:hypothetical protein